MKLENHLYLIKREDGHYLLAFPVYDLSNEIAGWRDQSGIHYPSYDDDNIIGSVDRIEERKHVRERTAEKFIKGLHITRDQVGVRLPDNELCECGNPECDGTGTYKG